MDTTLKVQRGGSFLCDPKVCHGFRVSARQACPAETALMHTGFRTAYSPASAPHIRGGLGQGGNCAPPQ
ncbi:MAG: formylglycine-generating enzyme family protein [Microscillaceae bacterium]|nr:formylglycine-generating enzyme family protein [Microscillaceae bacterium]